MPHDSDYFRRRAAEVRAAAFCQDYGEAVEVAGDLALAYAALARRRAGRTRPLCGGGRARRHRARPFRRLLRLRHVRFLLQRSSPGAR
jgi:hypothetical protein